VKSSTYTAVVFMASCMLVSRAAAAQNGFAVNDFQPSEPGSEWFSTESLDLRGHLRPSIGVVGDWAYRPLVVDDASGNERDAVVDNQFFVHAGASLVLWDRIRASLSLPILAFTDGTTAAVKGETLAKPSSSAAIGDLRIGADVRLFGVYGEAITGAIGVDVELPTGTRGAYAGDGNVTASPRALIAGDLGHFVYAAKLGVTLRGLDESYGGAPVGSSVFFAASVGARLFDKKLVIGPEIFGESGITSGAFFAKQSTPVEGIFGAHYTVASDWRVGAGASAGFTSGLGSPTARGLLSVEWTPTFAPRDRDHDRVMDADDACPGVPGERTSDPRTNGCPSDRDGDGIPDLVDACPDVLGVASADPRSNGCPPDRDHDGIVDADDACPDVAGIKTSDPKTNGCPPPSDRDGDGVVDAEDACPDVAGRRTSDPKTNGCPEDPDRDKDGILNADPKRNGCPVAFVKEGEIKILDQVKFKTGSADILPGPDSEGVLTAVARVLSEHPEIKGVRVEGYTDDHGTPGSNLRLSRARAAAVVNWLMRQAIHAPRLISVGFGQGRPIDDNTTDLGRQNNRRVEFHIEGVSP
jgi:outer membrane protein OmpA-like peptidoglycan-associated protein